MKPFSHTHWSCIPTHLICWQLQAKWNMMYMYLCTYSTGFNGLNSSWWLKQSFVFRGFKEGWYHENSVHTFVLSWSDMLFDVHVFRTLHHGSWYVFLRLLVVCAVLTTFGWCNTWKCDYPIVNEFNFRLLSLAGVCVGFMG